MGIEIIAVHKLHRMGRYNRYRKGTGKLAGQLQVLFVLWVPSALHFNKVSPRKECFPALGSRFGLLFLTG
jgi:hypothetical protein